MTRRGSVLPTPDDSRIRTLIEEWPSMETQWPFPRFGWLTLMEELLRQHYPQARSRDLNVTARSLAPFPLAEKDW